LTAIFPRLHLLWGSELY